MISLSDLKAKRAAMNSGALGSHATGIAATHNAADVLIEIAEAALAWRGQPGGGRSDADVIRACEVLLVALAKITT